MGSDSSGSLGAVGTSGSESDSDSGSESEASSSADSDGNSSDNSNSSDEFAATPVRKRAGASKQKQKPKQKKAKQKQKGTPGSPSPVGKKRLGAADARVAFIAKWKDTHWDTLAGAEKALTELRTAAAQLQECTCGVDVE